MNHRAFAALAGPSLLAALSGISLNACSKEADSPANARVTKWQAVKAQTPPWRTGIFIEGVSLQEAYSKRKFRYEEYDAAAKKFPTVGACLTAEREKRALLAVDWYKIDSDVEAAVCLSRVANTIGSAKGMVGWFKAHDFRIIDVRRAKYWDTNSMIPPRAGIKIEAGWSLKEKGPLYRGGILVWLERLFRALNVPFSGYSVTFGAFVEKPGGVIYVSAITNTL